MENQMLFFFSALGAFNGLILSLYFAFVGTKKKFSNLFLSLLLIVLSIRVIKSVFFYFNPSLANIFIQTGLSACILIGPLLYLYINSQTNNEKSNWLIHIIPYFAVITILGIIYPYVNHQNIWSRWIVKGIYIQWFIYIAFSIKNIFPIFSKLKSNETLKKSDIWLLSIFIGVFLVWLGYSVAAYTSYIIGALSFTFILYLIVLLLIFRSDKATTFFQEKYRNKEFDTVTIKHLQRKISLVVEKELFLNPNLTLDETAKELGISKHILSQFLNETLGKSFTIFINEHRIERAKSLLKTKSNYTIEGVGYDSGFNSKSSFFTSFKKITGQTPFEFQKKQGL